MTDQDALSRIRSIRTMPIPYSRPGRVRLMKIAAVCELLQELDGEPFDFSTFAHDLRMPLTSARRYLLELQKAGLFVGVTIPERVKLRDGPPPATPPKRKWKVVLAPHASPPQAEPEIIVRPRRARA